MQEGNTLGELVERYLFTKLNPNTELWYSKHLRPMASFTGPEREISSITRRDAEEYWKHLRSRRVLWREHPSRPAVQRELSKNTLHNTLRAIRTFFTDFTDFTEMVRQRLNEYNPFDHLRAGRDRRPVRMQAITPEDLSAIWKAARASSARDFAIVTTLATTGIRAGELVSMSPERIDLKMGTAWVEGKRGWRKVFLGTECSEALPACLWFSIWQRYTPIRNISEIWRARRSSHASRWIARAD